MKVVFSFCVRFFVEFNLVYDALKLALLDVLFQIVRCSYIFFMMICLMKCLRLKLILRNGYIHDFYLLRWILLFSDANNLYVEFVFLF